MATLRLSREQLSTILGGDFEAIRQFEQLFTMTNTNEVVVTETRTLAELAAYAPEAPLGSLGVQSADDVEITGGAISGLNPPLPTASGGTGQAAYADGELLIGKTDGTLAKAGLTAGAAISVTNGDGSVTVANTAPDQIVTLTAGANITITGTYPDFTIDAADAFTGTVTSVDVSGGTTGLTTSGGPVTTSGTITLEGTLSVANGGTGATTAGVARAALGAAASGAITASGITIATARLAGRSTAGTGPVEEISVGTGLTLSGGVLSATGGSSGTVTSVAASGGTTGLTFTGTPITTSGTLTLGGTLAVSNGGTGTTTAFTAGSIVFAGASGVYTQDNAGINFDSATDKLTVAGDVQARKFLSTSGAQNLAHNTFLTIATLTGAAPRSYLVTFAVNAANGANMTISVVAAGNNGSGGPALSVVDLQNGGTTEVAVAGGDVRVRQTTGVAQDVTWSITRLM